MSNRRLALADEQRALLALLKNRAIADPAEPSPDAGPPGSSALGPYLELVRTSRGLGMLRTITSGWLRFDLRRAAPLTSTALVHAGRFEAEIGRVVRDSRTPSAVDALGLYFVETFVGDDDPLIAAVARTERALIHVAHGDRSRHDVAWDRDPAPVLNALLAGESPGPAAAGNYRVLVSHELPGRIQVSLSSP